MILPGGGGNLKRQLQLSTIGQVPLLCLVWDATLVLHRLSSLAVPNSCPCKAFSSLRKIVSSDAPCNQM
jgi:hypothetical protein